MKRRTKCTFYLQYNFVVLETTKQKQGNEPELFRLSAHSETYSSLRLHISAPFSFTHSSIMNMEAEGSFETLVIIYQATPIHMPED
jgi:hypothetical protein